MSIYKFFKKTFLIFFCLALLLLACPACSLLDLSGGDSGSSGGSGSSSSSYTATVHYYDSVTRSYTVKKGGSFTAEYLAEPGTRITGLYSQDGSQYASWDCKVSNWNSSSPTDLYAKYESVSTQPYHIATMNDEDPKKISVYETWGYKVSILEMDGKDDFVSACHCNPYSDLTFRMTFLGKGNGDDHKNDFFANITLGEEKIASISKENLGNSYATYTVSGTVKAKQLINQNFQLIVRANARYGYTDYAIKNVTLTATFSF